MSLLAGTRLGPYDVISLIGVGGMGEVYEARDTRLNRDVAIKVLPALFARDPDRMARLEQEARAAAALNAPGIVAVYDIGTHDGAPFIVSELLDGESLRGRLDEGPVPPRKAAEYAAQIASAIAAALQAILSRCLEKRPDDRFHSAHDLALALQAAGTGRATTTSVERVVPKPPARVLPWMLATLALAIAAVAAIAVFAPRRPA